MNRAHCVAFGLFFLLSTHLNLHGMDKPVTYDHAKSAELRSYLNGLVTKDLSTTIKKLVGEGADPIIAGYADGTVTSTMHIAARSGDVDLLEFLLAKGVDVDINDALRNTPMAWAAFHDQVDAVAFLVKRGANINAQDQGGETIFMKALRTGSQRVIAFLVDKDLKIEARDRNHETALYYAVDHEQLSAANQLIALGANMKIKNRADFNVVMLAAKRGFTNLIVQFASAGVDVDAHDQAGWTALMYAVGQNRKEAVIALVGMGATVTLGYSPLKNDARKLLHSWLPIKPKRKNENYFFSSVRLRLNDSVANVLAHASSEEIKSLVSLVDVHGQTTLDVAMASRNNEAIEILLRHGADPLQGILNGLVLAARVPAWHNKNDDDKPSISEQIYRRHYVPIVRPLPALQQFPDEIIHLIIFWLSEIQFQDARNIPLQQ